ncbi:hypothetical protein DCAR_0416851 [Daucus carota subsp. sativus]|uniref:Uncharacterized protein n=1 Tax=Daucus carota subsp. sativus TaxID=79200 RepID=A0A165XUH5_DAUCS|nr:hypothetical protein DCAR_0416851 [Daucus carota subsp. sativus]
MTETTIALTTKMRSIVVVVSNKEVPKTGVADEESPVTNKSNFFVKVSEKRQQKIQQKDQSCVGSVENDNKSSSHEDDAKCSSSPDSEANDEKSPQRRKRRCTATSEKHGTSATRKKRHASATPEKRGRNTTPKQKVIASGSNSGKYGQIKNPTESEHTSQLTPNLHLEAKLKAESNGSSDSCPIQVDEVLLHHSPNKQDSFPNAPYPVLTDEQVPFCEKSGQREASCTIFAIICLQICGNGERVHFLNNWLRLWHEKGSGTSKLLVIYTEHKMLTTLIQVNQILRI